MKNHVKIGKAMEFYKEENDVVRISVEIPNNWSEYIGEDSIKSYCYHWTTSNDNPNFEIPSNSELKEFKEDMLFKTSDIVDLYNYISHPENLNSNKHFTIKSLETNGKVYYISIFPVPQSKNKIKIALRIAKYQYQPFMEKSVAVVFFPFSYQLHLKHYLREFLT
jgi:hypothetical protein